MVWLRALSAITAMSCCAPSTSGHQTGQCTAWRGLPSRSVLGKRNKRRALGEGGGQGRQTERKRQQGKFQATVVISVWTSKMSKMGRTNRGRLVERRERSSYTEQLWKQANPAMTRHDICKQSKWRHLYDYRFTATINCWQNHLTNRFLCATSQLKKKKKNLSWIKPIMH